MADLANSTFVPSRRAFFGHAALSGIAATRPPIYTVPAVADAAILALGPVIAELIVATDRAERDACAAYELVQEMVGPEPKKPRDAAFFGQYSAYKAAMKRFEEESAIVTARRQKAERATKLDALDEAADAANDAEFAKFVELVALQVKTLDGLILKAKLAERRNRDQVARSIVDDLLAMA